MVYGGEKIERNAHVKWAKDRAIEILESGDVAGAFASMASDLGKHEETQGHPAIGLGMMQMLSGFLSTESEMKKFIEGFN